MRNDRPLSTRFLVLGIALVLLGIGAYLVSGAASVTALIPAFIGLPITGAALVARRSPTPLRWQVVAASLALLGLAGSLRGVMQLPALVTGEPLARPMAVGVQSVMALLCLVVLVPAIARMSTLRFADGRFDRQ